MAYGLMDSPSRPRSRDTGPQAPTSGPGAGMGRFDPPIAVTPFRPFPQPGTGPPFATLPFIPGNLPPLTGGPASTPMRGPATMPPGLGGVGQAAAGPAGGPQFPQNIDMAQLLPFLLSLYQ